MSSRIASRIPMLLVALMLTVSATGCAADAEPETEGESTDAAITRNGGPTPEIIPVLKTVDHPEKLRSFMNVLVHQLSAHVKDRSNNVRLEWRRGQLPVRFSNNETELDLTLKIVAPNGTLVAQCSKAALFQSDDLFTSLHCLDGDSAQAQGDSDEAINAHFEKANTLNTYFSAPFFGLRPR